MNRWRAASFCFLLLAATAQADSVRQLRLPTKDLVYNPAARQLYASVPGGAGAGGNSVAVIDPAAGTLVRSVFVGSEPGKLALSDDGRYLYVALDGAAAVQRMS